ncbi:SRPBCC domain-containing protein [Leifsonia sp. PS1209]|uniref:SRPBCC domain-containing protein n=1 Tax=Leifsonia sp. PS1209 TaxID=2724914 RepID=UPI001442DE21|nr:SRPBCC domain-containing protein [Leifsonia sp. PS1209]QIZ97814.1 hypothetical protein HF024_04285 [Leifsonia sp. PS1209]
MAAPTGRLIRRDDGVYVVLDRIFHASIEEVWSYLSRSPRLASWVGEFTGSPATGALRFRLNGDDAAWEDVSVLECEAPHRFAADIGRAGDSWRVYWHVVQSGGHTTLTFGRRLGVLTDSSEGARWDYYLDRLVAVHDRTALPRWEEYVPAMSRYYQMLATLPLQERGTRQNTAPAAGQG